VKLTEVWMSAADVPVKAFQRRQVALLNHLAGVGYPPETIVSLMLMDSTVYQSMTRAQIWCTYLERRAVVGRCVFRRARVHDADGARLKAGNLSATSRLAARRRQCEFIVLSAAVCFRAVRSRDALRANIESFVENAGLAARALTQTVGS